MPGARALRATLVSRVRFPDSGSAGLSYHGTENVPTVPDISAGEPVSPSPLATSTAPDQATQLRYALGLAYCQPYVEAIFNFLIRDDSNLLGYQSGVLWADWRPKDSYGPLATVVAQLNARTLSCAAPTAPAAPAAQLLDEPSRISLQLGRFLEPDRRLGLPRVPGR